MKLLMENWRKFLVEEFEDEEFSEEATLVDLLFKGQRAQATSMFRALYDQLDLNLLATEIDDRLLEGWNRIAKLKAEVEAAKNPRWRTRKRPPWIKPDPDYQAKFRAHYKGESAWFISYGEVIMFLLGVIDGNRPMGRPAAQPDIYLYRDSTNTQEVLHDALRQTVAAWREEDKPEKESDEE